MDRVAASARLVGSDVNLTAFAVTLEIPFTLDEKR